MTSWEGDCGSRGSKKGGEKGEDHTERKAVSEMKRRRKRGAGSCAKREVDEE